VAVGPDAETLGPFAPSFIVDRAAVWEKLAKILLTNDAFTVIKGTKKTQNGRLAYQLLYAHYLGPNNVGNMAGEAESVLNMVQYHGEKRQWNFEKYALMHLRQHLILEALMAHGYVGNDPGSKVRFLLAGIRCSTLDAVKTRIILDESIRSDFTRCVTLFKDFVKQTAQTLNAQLGIAALSVRARARTAGSLWTSGTLSPRMSRTLSARLALIARRSQAGRTPAGRTLQRAVPRQDASSALARSRS
jgi:hypothetical protein